MARKTPKKAVSYLSTGRPRRSVDGFSRRYDETMKDNHSYNKNDDTAGKAFSWKTFDMDKFFKEADSIKEIGYRLEEEDRKDGV